MPNPVTITPWRDVKTDPPTGKWRQVMLLKDDGTVTSAPTDARWWAARMWAELPVIGELTDDDMKEIADTYFDSADNAWPRSAAERIEARLVRLDAAMRAGESPAEGAES